ncbi:DUF4440 domain-containing protein [Streptomyces sp. NPDC085946]|uniref:nuclear transport factor 2 family protein n=1 Tax=Streptomyces sp. NPDC085946 TaxID=3365744 RepID=UPI0037D2896E
MPEPTAAVDAAVRRELALLDPQVRRSPARLGALLHPDFHEFGASGRHWDRASVIAALTEGGETGPGTAPVVISRPRGVQLAPDVVHLTFATEHHGRRAHRSSLWRLTGDGWLLYFHQATPFDAPRT